MGLVIRDHSSDWRSLILSGTSSLNLWREKRLWRWSSVTKGRERHQSWLHRKPQTQRKAWIGALQVGEQRCGDWAEGPTWKGLESSVPFPISCLSHLAVLELYQFIINLWSRKLNVSLSSQETDPSEGLLGASKLSESGRSTGGNLDLRSALKLGGGEGRSVL